MRGVMRLMLAGAVLAGCPSTAMNRPAPASDAAGELADVGGEDAVGDADAGDALGDVSEVGDTADAGEMGDAADASDAGDVGDAGDAGDAPGVQMTIEFSSAGLSGPEVGGVQMRANIAWHGALRGTASGVTFEGEIR